MSSNPGSVINSGLSSRQSSNKKSDEARKDETPFLELKITNPCRSNVVVHLVRKPVQSCEGLTLESALHWHLVFYFKDAETYFVYEAGRLNGILTPNRRPCASLSASYVMEQEVDSHWPPQAPREVPPSTQTNPPPPLESVVKVYTFKAPLTISLADLHSAAANNRLNYKPYSAVTNNCQHWVTELCNSLGIGKELEGLPTFYSTVKTAQMCTFSVSVAVIAGCVGGTPMALVAGSVAASSASSPAALELAQSALWSPYHTSDKSKQM